MSENLGQVAGLYIGMSAPVNTKLIWFDSTPAVRLHKVYNTDTSSWEVLNKNAIINITYSELRGIAQGVGLAQGSWYKITDLANVLALAITVNKIQYCDVDNNIIIDDLVSVSTYTVNSGNLLIDDVNGVWDSTTKKLKFTFASSDTDIKKEDTLFGKKNRNGVISLVKYKLSSLLSTVTGNSIVWNNNGFYFNFNDVLNNRLDVAGGVVSVNSYLNTVNNILNTLNNLSQQNQAILQAAKTYTDNKTSDVEIYGKKLPTAPTAGTAIDIAQNDTLSVIVNKIQRWITQFKKADGIGLTQDFAETPTGQGINNSDTVDSALRKVQYWIHHMNTDISLPDDWVPSPYNSTIPSLIAGDPFITAFSKLQGKLNQLGYISNGVLTSRAVTEDEEINVTVFSINSGKIEFATEFDWGNSDRSYYSSEFSSKLLKLHEIEVDGYGDSYISDVEIQSRFSKFKHSGSFQESVSNKLMSMLLEGNAYDTAVLIRNNNNNNSYPNAVDLTADRIKNVVINTHISVFNVIEYTAGTNQIVNDGLVILPYNYQTSTAASVVKLPVSPKNGTIIRIISLVPNSPNHITEIQVGDSTNHRIFNSTSNQVRIYPDQYKLYTFVFYNNLWYSFLSSMYYQS